jgi:3',5'-cyclic AMP phosphodiesterase CpdA
MVSFAVLSDAHLYSAFLGMTGRDFRQNIDAGRNLIHLSDEIVSSVVDSLSADKNIQFILICGDLTKDGEYENHLRMRDFLGKLEASGKKVYVVPGNHDINNYRARRFLPSGSEPVPSVTPQEFSALYGAFGYDEAISRDPHSLSYVAEPVAGLWVFGLDACTYEKNSPNNPLSTYGEFKNDTLLWLEKMLLEARDRKKTVIGFMHHGLLEHFASEAKYFSAYVVKNNEAVARLCAFYGMRFIFTGHFHAQDITFSRFTNSSAIFDVETASLVTYPCAYRTLRFIGDGKTEIVSHRVTTIPSVHYFSHYALMMMWVGVSNLLHNYLTRYQISEQDARLLVPELVQALEAHTAGDESPSQDLIETKGMSPGLKILIALVGDFFAGVWHDLPPPDNDVMIDYINDTWDSPAKK